MDAETWPKMMTIMQQQQQEKKNKKKKNDVQLQAMWFAAGTAVAMACLQRAILMSFMEQWRMLVFLALNLLLLAILFTSTHNNLINSISSTTDGGRGGGTGNGVEVDVVDGEKKSKKQTGVSSASADPPPPAVDEHKKEDNGNNTEDDRSESELLNCKISSKTENLIHIIKETENHHLKKEDGETHQDRDQYQEISMEELNRRAEAFIAMFRQHLLSDAKVANGCRLHPYSSSEAKGGVDEMFIPKSRAYRIA